MMIGADPCAWVDVTRVPIAEGDAGIYATVRAMRELIHAGMSHPVVRRHAEAAVADVRPGDYAGELAAVARYLAARTVYRRDPEDTEYLQAPWWVLQCGIERGTRPALDCDDLVVLSLTMLGSLGFRTMIRLVSTDPAGEFAHTYGLAEVRGEWVEVDLTRAWTPSSPRPAWTRVEDVPV